MIGDGSHQRGAMNSLLRNRPLGLHWPALRTIKGVINVGDGRCNTSARQLKN